VPLAERGHTRWPRPAEKRGDRFNVESADATTPDPSRSVATLLGGKLERACDRCGEAFVPKRKAQRFCSRSCRAGWWDDRHPRINALPSGPRTEPLWKLILGALQDGAWHSAHDLAAGLRADKHSVVTRLSELAKRGHAIETDLPPGNAERPHQYRLLAQEAQ
jgi:hypothetical protein